MPNQRTRIQLTEEEQRDFLREARTVQTATIGPDGRPHLVPMWFNVDDEGCIVYTTYRKAQKVQNLRRDPRVTLLIEGGDAYNRLRGMMIEGEAEIIDDPDYTSQTLGLIGTKYRGAGSPYSGEGPRVAPKRVVIRVHPQHVVSWDHSKLGS